MGPSKNDWILAILRKSPLDRIHIMKSLFLIQHRSKEPLGDFFHFEPYYYGPYSLEIYSQLRSLLDRGLITQPPHQTPQQAKYYLTALGRIEAEDAIRKFSPYLAALLEEVVEEISGLSFMNLLRKVYREAPESASRSIVKELIDA